MIYNSEVKPCLTLSNKTYKLVQIFDMFLLILVCRNFDKLEMYLDIKFLILPLFFEIRTDSSAISTMKACRNG